MSRRLVTSEDGVLILSPFRKVSDHILKGFSIRITSHTCYLSLQRCLDLEHWLPLDIHLHDFGLKLFRCIVELV